MLMLDKSRCVVCNCGSLMANGESSIVCPVCSAIYPIVQGIPFLGYYCRDDFLSLMEIAAVADTVPQRAVPDFFLWDRACDIFYRSGDEKTVTEMLGSGYQWFPWRYPEWQLWRCLLRDVNLTGAAVLDVGAGEGFDAWRLQQRGGHITALEYNAAFAALGKRNLPEARWLGGFSHILPFQDNSFDFVVCNAALHHMRDIPAAISEFLRVLRPGGLLLTAADSFSPNRATDKGLLEVFNAHPYVLAGVNENSPRLREFLTTLEHRRSGLEISVLSSGIFGNDELGLPLNYVRCWSLEDFTSANSNRSGALALKVRKLDMPAIPAAIQNHQCLGADMFDSLYLSGNGIAGLMAHCPPPERYVNLSLPHANFDKFLQLNGWRLPTDSTQWQEGWGRINSFWRRGPQDACVCFEVEAPVHSFSTQVELHVSLNGAECFHVTLIRGLRYAVYLDISALPVDAVFVPTLRMADADDFGARILRVYRQYFTTLPLPERTCVVLGEGPSPGLAGLLAYRFARTGMLHVMCLPGAEELRRALYTLFSSQVPARYYFPENMEIAALADWSGKTVSFFKYDKTGIRDCLERIPLPNIQQRDIIILFPKSDTVLPGWLKKALQPNDIVLSYIKDSIIAHAEQNDHINAIDSPQPARERGIIYRFSRDVYVALRGVIHKYTGSR